LRIWQILTTIGRSPSFLKDIISEARRDYLLAQSRKTMVYTLSPTPFAQKTWDQGRHRPARDISTVIMPPEEKEHLLQDIKEYLKPSAMNWYAQRGLPYRRGYLFYGPPGTGKTSLSLALAGELKLPLYILSLATGSLTDETLTMLFNSLPRKCIVLLEDIDCAGVYRQGDTDDWDSDDDDADETDGDTDSSSSGKSSGSAKNSKSTGSKSNNDKKDGNSSKGSNSSAATSGYPRSRISVSFSGLLNAIDGVASHEGRILIMTTNHRERLDKALIRPGRVDVQIEFGHADKETLAEIFRALYKEIGEPEIPGSFDSKDQVDKKRRSELEMRDEVRQMAERFAERIPTNKFTPAEIQGFLMSYKGRPSDALGNIDAWVRQRTKPERKRKSRAASETRENSAQDLPASTCPASTTTNGITSLEGIHSKSSASSADTSVLLDQITRFNERIDLLLTKQELASKQSSTTTDTDSATPPPTKAHSNGVLTNGYQYESGDTSEDEPSILQKSKKEES
jgi:chaperone BCS1